MSEYILERDKFKPEEVKFLIIAESPPASGGYFYFDKTTGKDSLFRETIKSLELFPENERMRKCIDKTNMLSARAGLGWGRQPRALTTYRNTADHRKACGSGEAHHLSESSPYLCW